MKFHTCDFIHKYIIMFEFDSLILSLLELDSFVKQIKINELFF